MAPARTSGTDPSVWALAAIVIAALAAIIGYAIAQTTGPTWNTVHRQQALASQQGQLTGMNRGFAAGRKTGRQQENLRGQYEQVKGQAKARTSGFNAGVRQSMAQRYAQYGSPYGYGSYGSGYGSYGYSPYFGYGGYANYGGYGGYGGDVASQAMAGSVASAAMDAATGPSISAPSSGNLGVDLAVAGL